MAHFHPDPHHNNNMQVAVTEPLDAQERGDLSTYVGTQLYACPEIGTSDYTEKASLNLNALECAPYLQESTSSLGILTPFLILFEGRSILFWHFAL